MCFPSPTTTSDNHLGQQGEGAVHGITQRPLHRLTRQPDGTPLASYASGNSILVHHWQALLLVFQD
jgi:hypothetical protein